MWQETLVNCPVIFQIIIIMILYYAKQAQIIAKFNAHLVAI